MNRMLCLLLGSGFLFFVAGCSTYLDDYQYVPRPAVVNLSAATQPAAPPLPPVTAFANIVGVRRAAEGLPACVHVRLRVENNTPEGILFDPRSMQLLDGELVNFPMPFLQPLGEFNLAPGESAVVSAFFPFLPGRSWDDTNLNSLQLKFGVLIDGRGYGQTVSFRRSYPYYYDPYYPYGYGYYPGPYPFVGFGGVVVIHGRR